MVLHGSLWFFMFSSLNVSLCFFMFLSFCVGPFLYQFLGRCARVIGGLSWMFWYVLVDILVDIRQHRHTSAAFSLPRLVRDIFQQGGWSAMGRSCELHRWWLRHKVNGKPHLTTWHGISGIAATAGCRLLSTSGWLLHIYVCISICIYIYVCIYIYTCICIYIYLSTYLFIYYLFVQFYSCIYICVCVQYMVIHLCIIYSASTCAMPQTLLGWLSFWVTVTVLVAFHYVELVKLHVPHEASWGTWLPTLCGESADFL